MKRQVTDTINFGVLPGEALVSIGGDLDAVISREKDKDWLFYLNGMKEDGLTTNFANRTTIDDVLYASIFLENKKGEDWYAMVAHEVLHMCQFLCHAHVINMIQEKEMVAYLHTHIMKQILQINKKKK